MSSKGGRGEKYKRMLREGGRKGRNSSKVEEKAEVGWTEWVK